MTARAAGASERGRCHRPRRCLLTAVDGLRLAYAAHLLSSQPPQAALPFSDGTSGYVGTTCAMLHLSPASEPYDVNLSRGSSQGHPNSCEGNCTHRWTVSLSYRQILREVLPVGSVIKTCRTRSIGAVLFLRPARPHPPAGRIHAHPRSPPRLRRSMDALGTAMRYILPSPSTVTPPHRLLPVRALNSIAYTPLPWSSPVPRLLP
ncbi:uncharacterized protein C8Q71DRAFT_94493 [Rhodofomes roseus]|uniref:Uncharacterized protein n=1 Tax=Rhodofomes roseus TaxID=34475 RepID=A0ABQ8KDX8_9APHY|nr:uncharacterized protein C8Q71DRAFT_94493 [Rhodofomes roseus]KAH9835757.1 hypothetical protein C8Q71DRAFT_94493 [Rhodofomes roseus]